MKEYTSYTTPYSEGEAERGKFVVIDPTYLQTTYDYPSSGRGRYAVLTKQVDPINFSNTASDAFGRLRVSEPYTLFGSKFTLDKNTEYWDEITANSATSTHVSADACVNLNVTTTNDYVIRQTKQHWIYQPGKSQFILLTFSNANIQTNVYKRIGSFYSNSSAPYNVLDGIYFESNGVTNSYNFCIAKSEGANTTTQVAQQSAWNVDKMDGTGKSGINLDFSKNQILYIDYEWLGVGTVRAGFVIDGKFYVAHEFHHSNITQGVYMTTPNLPIRYEIRSIGSSATGMLKQICSSVMSEGGWNLSGPTYTITRALCSIGTFSDANAAVGDIIPFISLRLKSGKACDNIVIKGFSISYDNAPAATYEILLLKNSGHTGTDTTPWLSLDNSAIEYKARNTITSRISAIGSIIHNDFYIATNQSKTSLKDSLEDVLALGTNIDGTSDRIDLAIRKLDSHNDNTTNFFSSITFTEIR